MYCKYCGNEVNENAVVCIKCGCAVDEQRQEQSVQPQTNTKNQSQLAIIAKVFMIIGCVITGFYLFPLCWTIPMTITLSNKLKNNQPIGVGFKVCILIFVSTISGILLLCMNNDTKKEPYN